MLAGLAEGDVGPLLHDESEAPFACSEIGPLSVRASFSQKRMQYLADEGTVVYSAKGGKDRKVFDAPEWLAAMCSQVPNRGEQMVRPAAATDIIFLIFPRIACSVCQPALLLFRVFPLSRWLLILVFSVCPSARV